MNLGIDTSEKDFEASIEAALLAGGPDAVADARLLAEDALPYGEPSAYLKRTSEDYDRARCLCPRRRTGFPLGHPAPDVGQAQEAARRARVKDRFLQRLVKEIATRGTLDVLRQGVVDLGCKFDLAYFRPETGLNDEHRRLYAGQHPGRHAPGALQREEREQPGSGAVPQRPARLHRRTEEPADGPDRRARHRAVPARPRPQRAAVRLRAMPGPLRRGPRPGLHDDATCAGRDPLPALQPRRQRRRRGQPAAPATGYKTAYLWEQVWQRDSLLDILSHFIAGGRGSKTTSGKKTGETRPDLPPLPPTRCRAELVDHARQQGGGQRYLIQHSAGSGKSNTIAWLAHRLAGAARRPGRAGLRLHHRHHRPAGARPAAAAAPSAQLRAGHRRGGEHRARPPQVDARRWRTGKNDHRHHAPEVPVHAGASVGALPGAALRGHHRRGALLADAARAPRAQAGAAAPSLERPRRTTRRRAPTPKTCITPSRSGGSARAAAQRQLLRLHRHAQGQDAGAVRRPQQADGYAALQPLLDAPGHRGRLHPRRAEELHHLPGLLSACSRRVSRRPALRPQARRSPCSRAYADLHEHAIETEATPIMVEHFADACPPPDRRSGQGHDRHPLPPARRALQAGVRPLPAGAGLPATRRWSLSPARYAIPTPGCTTPKPG